MAKHEAQATVSSDKPDVWVTVREGVSLTHEGKEVKPGKRFRCHMDEAMSLLQSGAVDVGEVAK